MSTEQRRTFPEEMLAAHAASEDFRNHLSPEDQKRFDHEVMSFRFDRARQMLDEVTFRRQWAQRIRDAFSGYHEHSADGGECGACGAIQAANWMDPDYAKDGPSVETYAVWKGRQG